MKSSKRGKQWLFSLILVAVLAMAGGNFGWAQVTASMSGRVEDASGAAIPAASVIVTNLETGASRAVTTDEAGRYRALSLPVGRYQIKAEKTGFNAAVQTGISLVVGQEAVVNLRMQVGEVRQEVTVTSEAPVVNTTTASVSGLVGEKQVKDLPLNGRSFDNLITLNTGAINVSSRTVTSAKGGPTGSSFSVAGKRPEENVFLLNGVQLTGVSGNNVTPGGVSGQLLGVDAVREFNVLSSNYGAEYGYRAGAQISIVTQSGTNALHGSVFEFLRNSDLDARNFFDYPLGERIPPFRRNQFGGALGGPIKKDKTFLFGNYEGFRQRLAISDVTIVPDANARQGLLPNAQGVPTPVPGLVPAMIPLLNAYYPAPNGPVLGGGISETFSNPKQSIREDYGTTRLDHTFSDKDSLSGIYTLDDGNSLTPQPNPIFDTAIAMRYQVASMHETHIFSPQVINVLTVGFTRAAYDYVSVPEAVIPPNVLTFVGNSPLLSFAIGGATVSGTSGSSSTLTSAGTNPTPHSWEKRTLFTYTDGVQLIKGRHQISAGVWFMRVHEDVTRNNYTFGTATFSNLTTFLQGTVATFTAVPFTTPAYWRVWEGAWYVDDAIQVRSNLTIRVGVRHEFTNGWNEATGRSADYGFGPDGVLSSNPVTGNSPLTENNAKWLFGPRVGLAWDPFGKGKTSIRAGFGTYYDLQDAIDGRFKNQPPYNTSTTFQTVSLFSFIPISNTTPLPPLCGPGVPKPCTVPSPSGVQSNMKTPVVQSWNFTVEQQLTANTSLSVGYQGYRGSHQFVGADWNSVPSQICQNAAGCISGGINAARGFVPQGAQYIPVVATRPNPYLTAGGPAMTEGASSYNALAVEVNHRFGHGLQFRGNYTFSKILDDQTTGQVSNAPGTFLDPYNPMRDWSLSTLNITHQASGNLIYELPIGHGKPWLKGVSGAADKLASGWQVNGIVTLISGAPFTPLIGANLSGNGNTGLSDRPSVNPAFTGPVTLGSPNRWFDPNAYILPTVGTFGNLGRDVLNGPGLGILDFALFKNTAISERLSLQFRAECFNILNRANFATPNSTVFSGGAISPSAGVITSTTTTSRQIQFGLKLVF